MNCKLSLCLIALAAPAWAQPQPLSLRMHADNEAYAFLGNATAVIPGPFVTAKWPTIGTGNTNYTPPNSVLYIAASNDKAALQGLMVDVQFGTGLASRILTGAAATRWRVCETGKGRLAVAPTPAALSAEIVNCNNSNGWKTPMPGLANANAVSPFWGKRTDIDDNTGWIWYPRGCNGSDAFYPSKCPVKEYLIFRLDLREPCPPPVPSFTIDTSSGWGVLKADANASTAEMSYFWSIQASDANWNGTGPEYSQWFTGTAGVFDLKQFIESKGGKLECNRHYRVKLAVSNGCIAWQDVTKLVRLECCGSQVKEVSKPGTALP